MEEEIEKLGAEIMELSRNMLLVDHRFLDAAISKLTLSQSDKTEAFMTDGKALYYAPLYVLRLYKAEKDSVARSYLHIVLHCVLCHSFVGKKIDRLRWDLACDIAVESLIDELGTKGVLPSAKNEYDNILSMLKRKIDFLTAERIYHYLCKTSISEREFYEWQRIFFADEHDLWYSPDLDENAKLGAKGWQQKNLSGSNSDSQNGMNGENGRSGRSDSGNGDRESDSGKGSSDTGSGSPSLSSENSDTQKEWKRIAESVEQDLETFSKNAGSSAGGLIKNLKELNREKYDYEAFLKKFAVRGEVMKTSEDEFDYVFYTYGLKLYGNLPLVEPLEYRDTKRIKEFVIAIDTSGSCSGELVNHFIEKTYNILKSTESFFSKIKIHIVQCDSKIQHDDVITSREDFEQYMKDVKIYGGGGTDFRPVFRYVDELIDSKEFSDLRGIIYFTDGIGIFPEKKPPYETAFIFVEDGDREITVPSWAIKLILRKNDMEEGEEL